MSTHGKTASSQKTLNYYGTIAGAICWGPLDWLTAIICNGNYVWQCSSGGPLDLTLLSGVGAPNSASYTIGVGLAGGFTHSGGPTSDGYIDLTSGILDPTLFIDGGYARLYCGMAFGNPDAALGGHPAYRDSVVLVLQGIFFGQNSGTAPNLQVIGGRIPRAPSTHVAAADNIIDADRQVNPIAALAEILLDERGAGLTAAQLDATSWLAAAHWCAQDAAHIAYSFVSPLFTEQAAMRDLVKALLDPINAYLRWLPNGTLGCYVYEWGVAPGSPVQLDARHFVSGSQPKFNDGDWADVPTEIVVTFTDRAYEFQENSTSSPNQRAAEIRQLDDSQTLDRKHVTRLAQAQSQGTEYLRRLGLAPGTATISVRGPIVAGLLPGDKIEVDTNPEPGGSGSYQLARIEKITTDRTDETTLDLTLDPLLPAIAYTPPWTSPRPETTFAGAVETAPSLVHLLSLPLPPAYFGWPPCVGFVATRAGASSTLAGFHAYFSTNSGLPFAELGAQTGFAVRCSLVNAALVTDTVLRIQQLDGAAGPEAYLAAATPGGNAAQAADNTLLAILVVLDGSGRVALDGGNEPIMEFCSVLSRSAVTADTHDYTVYRGRCSLPALAWGASAVAWIVPRANLVAWTHDEFASLLGTLGYFRLASFTSAAVDDTIPLPECDLNFPAAFAADSSAQFTISLSSEAHTVACDATGTPNAGEIGGGSPSVTTVTVIQNGAPLTAVASAPGPGQFAIALGTLTATGASKIANDTIEADPLGSPPVMSADTATIEITINILGVFTVTKVFTLTKAYTGAPGPGLVYVGVYNSATVYFCTPVRTDVVLASGNYYPAANRAKSGLATWGAPGGSDWGAAMTNFAAIATGLLLTQDATISNTLVMGDGSTGNGGIIRSIGATAFLTGAGFWLNPRDSVSHLTQFRAGDPTGGCLAFDGAQLTAGGFMIGSSFLSAGSGVNQVTLASTSSPYLLFGQIGSTAAIYAIQGLVVGAAGGLTNIDLSTAGGGTPHLHLFTAAGVQTFAVDGATGNVGTSGIYSVGANQVVGAREANITAAGIGYNASATTATFTGTDTIDLATYVADRNAISGGLNNHGAAINTIIARLVAHGLIAP